MKKFYCPDCDTKDGVHCSNAGVILSAEEYPVIFCALDAARKKSILGKRCPVAGVMENVIPTADPQLSLF